jgi:hypothetical protein
LPVNLKRIQSSLGNIFAPRNRGILLDLVVFVITVLLLRVVTMLALSLVRQAEDNLLAKLAIGFFFAGLLFLQPLGPILKRWSFHQRSSFSTDSGAGCLISGFMFFYLAMMLMISGAAAIIIGEVIFEPVEGGSNLGIAFLLGGFVWSFVSVAIIFRYFLKPKRKPRWQFLTTANAAQLGDICMFLNVILLQILWSSLTASDSFRELATGTPLGKRGSFTDFLGRLIVVGSVAALVYFPGRIFYLVEDKRRWLTWVTMLLANLPLILGVVLASPIHSAPATAAGPKPPLMRSVLGKSSLIISAEDLYQDYVWEGQEKARQYAGKYLVITGSVSAVDLKEDDPAHSQVRLRGDSGFRFVYCRFDQDQIEIMKELKSNQKVTLQGVGEKYWIGGPQLNHCVLVSRE